jgi:hypothetical protein
MAEGRVITACSFRQEPVAQASRSCYSFKPHFEVIMKATVTIVFLLAGASSALGQSGVSNQRDMYGNLLRDSGSYSARGVNQGPQNVGPVRTMPAQPAPANVGRIQTQGR